MQYGRKLPRSNISDNFQWIKEYFQGVIFQTISSGLRIVPSSNISDDVQWIKEYFLGVIFQMIFSGLRNADYYGFCCIWALSLAEEKNPSKIIIKKRSK